MISYAIYLAAVQFLDYRVAYTTSFVFGIVFSYEANRRFVFDRASVATRNLIGVPLAYLFQYIFGLGIVYVLVEQLGVSNKVAPLLAIVLLIPLTFFFNKLAFSTK